MVGFPKSGHICMYTLQTDMRCLQANVATRVQAFLLMCMSVHTCPHVCMNVHTCPHVCMHFIVDFSACDMRVTQESHACCIELVAKL